MSSKRGPGRWAAAGVLLGLGFIFVWLAKGTPPPRQKTGVASGGAVLVQAEGPVAATTEAALGVSSTPGQPEGEVVPKTDASEKAVPVEKPKPELEFSLPTGNAALFSGPPEQFFMFVDRYTPEGQIQAWQGGGYGFVRNQRQTAKGTVFTKFHEGIDIAPVQRDAKGEPLDEVRAIADGVVGYVTTGPRTSNYGNYIVVLHQIGQSGVFYSLYAHLRSAGVAAGTKVLRGSLLGMLGYTGDGIDRRRAHVHLEIGMVLTERFDTFIGGAALNGHGNFHGSNLMGMNAAEFLAANHGDPQLMPAAFLQKQEVYYKVRVPNRGHELDLALRYPWLRQPGAAGASWEISFTGPGVPVAVRPVAEAVPFATVSWVKPFAGSHSWNTRSMLGGSGNTATLTKEGARFMILVSGDF